MEALAARKLDEAFEFFRLEPVTGFTRAATICGQATSSPGSRSNTMRSQVSRLSRREPRTWIFQRPRLHQHQHVLDVPDRNDVVILAWYECDEGATISRCRRYASGRMFRRRRLRGPHQRQRASENVRLHPVPDRDVIRGEVLFGHTGIGPVDAVGMGQLNLSERDAPGAGQPRFSVGALLAIFAAFPARGPPVCRRVAGTSGTAARSTGTSRTTSAAALSSRMPLNEAWRNTPPCVTPANSASTTSFGATQTTSLRRSSAGSTIGRRAVRTDRGVEQIVCHFLRVAGTDTAGVAQFAILVDRDGERADRVRQRGRWRKAGDHESWRP